MESVNQCTDSTSILLRNKTIQSLSENFVKSIFDKLDKEFEKKAAEEKSELDMGLLKKPATKKIFIRQNYIVSKRLSTDKIKQDGLLSRPKNPTLKLPGSVSITKPCATPTPGTSSALCATPTPGTSSAFCATPTAGTSSAFCATPTAGTSSTLCATSSAGTSSAAYTSLSAASSASALSQGFWEDCQMSENFTTSTPRSKPAHSTLIPGTSANIQKLIPTSVPGVKYVRFSDKDMLTPFNPFVVHPLSSGYDHRQTRAAFYYGYKEKKLSRREEKRLPLEAFNIKRKFFPNFVDPIPHGYKLRIPNPVPQTSQSILDSPTLQSDCVTSSGVKMSPQVAQSQTVSQEEGLGTISKGDKMLLLIFFDEMCPEMLKSTPRHEARNCSDRHAIPTVEYVEQQIFFNFVKDVTEVYQLILKFPLEFRKRFLPPCAKYFAMKQSMPMLKRMIRDHDKTGCDMQLIVDAMTESKWTQCEAVQYVIDNHIDTESARREIVVIIGKLGVDLLKFVDYLNSIK